MCVCTVIDHRWRHNVNNKKKYDTKRSREAWLFFTHCDVFCGLLQHTQTEKCDKKIQMIYWRFRGVKKKNKSADVIYIYNSHRFNLLLLFNNTWGSATIDSLGKWYWVRKLLVKIQFRSLSPFFLACTFVMPLDWWFRTLQ